MTITATAEDIYSLRQKIGYRALTGAVIIKWRSGDYGGVQKTGCIVDATSVNGEEVPKCFTTAAQAISYISKLIKRHESFVIDRAKKEKKSKDKGNKCQPR